MPVDEGTFEELRQRTRNSGSSSLFGTSSWTVLTVVTDAIFLLGFVLDRLEITLILMPIFGPVVAGLDFGGGLSGQPTLLCLGSSWQ